MGPVLSFLASTHTVLHRHLSKRRNILVVGLTYATTCLSFAVLYLLIADNDPHAFAMSAAESPFGLGKALYFSVVTISTTGYGDISPFSGLARCVACWEIITGIGLRAAPSSAGKHGWRCPRRAPAVRRPTRHRLFA